MYKQVNVVTKLVPSSGRYVTSYCISRSVAVVVIVCSTVVEHFAREDFFDFFHLPCSAQFKVVFELNSWKLLTFHVNLSRSLDARCRVFLY